MLKTFESEGGLLGVSRSYKTFGIHLQPNGDIRYKEWAPSAKSLTFVSKIFLIFSLETLTIGQSKSTKLSRTSMVFGI